LLVATAVSVLAFTVYPQRVYFDQGDQPYPEIPGLRRYYEQLESSRPQEFLAASRYLLGRGDAAGAQRVLLEYIGESEAYASSAEASARALDVRCLVFLLQKHEERCRLVAEGLRESGAADEARRLLEQADRIRARVEQMR